MLKLLLLVVLAAQSYGQTERVSRDYCVIGAGPSGLQMGHFLQKKDRDYVVFERNNISGSFFSSYPRHNKLISINKRFTGQTNKEFNFRHDWNSLISDDESLMYKYYSKDFFPQRETMLKYLDDYRTKLNINVQFNTKVDNIKQDNDSFPYTTMQDQNGNIFKCKNVILATGTGKPSIPQFGGVENTVGYEDISLNPEDYDGKTVLILGRGNSAFEVAQHIYGHTSLIHMVARSRVRLSWATHYVGDLRGVNNELLDTYQLKSLDAVLEAPVGEVKIVKVAGPSGPRYRVLFPEMEDDSMSDSELDNFAMRDDYDLVIRCLGFTFDDSILTNSTRPPKPKGRREKYPKINWDHQLWKIPNIYVVGTASHSLDHRKSAGGFIHGFRYTTQAVHNLLEWKNHKIPWPSRRYPVTQLATAMLKRLNEGSGIYQMFQMLGDVYIFRNGATEFDLLEEVPIHILPSFAKKTGHVVDHMIVQVLEYGANFSGPGKDIFRADRATGDPGDAHTSNFLHPVLYYYEALPTAQDFRDKSKYETLPRPKRMHHIVEDFLTKWDAPVSHILHLRRFLENVLNKDLKSHLAETCLKYALTYSTVPPSCKDQPITGTEDVLLQAHQSGIEM